MAGIPKVDPLSPKGPFERAVRRLARTKPVIGAVMAVSTRVDPWLLAHTNGRVATSIGFPVINVTTTGRKSGQPRTATLLYFTRGEDVVLVASSFGRDRHPAWYLNLKADPRAELLRRGRRGAYRAREAEEPERTELYALAEQLYAGYTDYAAKTDRKIPVLVLSPAADGA